MKTNLVLIGMAALTLGACDKKAEVSQSETLPKPKAAGSEQRLSSSKPVVAKPKPATETEIAQTPAAEPQGTPSTSPAPASAPARQTPPAVVLSPATEKLREERLARMAAARQERVAQTTEQLSTRFKQQDANGDGFLAKDEVSDRMQRRFTEADKNGDGFLDATEQSTMIQAVAERMGDGGGQRRGGQGFAGRTRGNP